MDRREDRDGGRACQRRIFTERKIGNARRGGGKNFWRGGGEGVIMGGGSKKRRE